MKRLMTILAATLCLAVCHAQSRDRKEAAGTIPARKVPVKQATMQDKYKALKNSFLQIAKMLEIKNVKADTKIDILEKGAQIDLTIRYLQTQNERKTKTLQAIVKIFGEKNLGVKRKGMVSISQVDMRTLREKMARIKTETEKAMVLEWKVKELEKKLKAAQGK